MLTDRLRDGFNIAADERGFTLIELLVTLIAGVVVFMAAFTVLDVSIGQTTRILSRSDVTQRSRPALQHIEAQLNSSCVGNHLTPIQPDSNGTHLVFFTGNGSEPTVNAVAHTITFNAAGNNGTLTDTTASGTTTVLAGVAQDGATPVFQYYAFGQPADSSNRYYVDQAGNRYQMLLDGKSPLPSGAKTYNGADASGIIPAAKPLATTSPPNGTLGDDNAAAASEVLISFRVYPQGSFTNQNLSNISQAVSDGVNLRLTPAPNHDNGQAISPCQ